MALTDVQIALYLLSATDVDPEQVPDLTPYVKQLMADVWTEAAEETSEWHASYRHGNNGPPDPPRNPYEEP